MFKFGVGTQAMPLAGTLDTIATEIEEKSPHQSD